MLEDIFIGEILERICVAISVIDRCTLARVSKQMKNIIYNPFLWHTIELPFPGSPSPIYEFVHFYPKKGGPKTPIYSTLKPPEDIFALERILNSMLQTKERFSRATYVNFKNYMFSDEAIQLAVQLFPSLEKLDLDGGKISIFGMRFLQNFKKLRFLSINCAEQSSWDAKEWLAPLDSHLERLVMIGNFDRLFLRKCSQCHFYFNPKFNSSKSCLHHSKLEKVTRHFSWVYKFACCGALVSLFFPWKKEFRYLGGSGCQCGSHVEEVTESRWAVEWLPELIDVPNRIIFEHQRRYLRRRDPKSIS